MLRWESGNGPLAEMTMKCNSGALSGSKKEAIQLHFHNPSRDQEMPAAAHLAYC